MVISTEVKKKKEKLAQKRSFCRFLGICSLDFPVCFCKVYWPSVKCTMHLYFRFSVTQNQAKLRQTELKHDRLLLSRQLDIQS